jgi:hypothetical protein
VTTNRTPIERPAVTMVSSRALDLYEAMSKLRCTCAPPPLEYWKHKMCAGCEAWWNLHSELDDELGCEPWQWPCVARQSAKAAGSTCMNDDIAARMATLRAAVKARRASPPSSEKEESSDVEPVVGQDAPTS